MGHEFTFTLTDDQLKVWQKFAELKGCTFEHLVKVMIPSLTEEFLLHIANPKIADMIEEEILTHLPVDMQEVLLRQRDRLNKKLSEPLDPNHE
jgi:hypothetical protein